MFFIPLRLFIDRLDRRGRYYQFNREIHTTIDTNKRNTHSRTHKYFHWSADSSAVDDATIINTHTPSSSVIIRKRRGSGAKGFSVRERRVLHTVILHQAHTSKITTQSFIHPHVHWLLHVHHVVPTSSFLRPKLDRSYIPLLSTTSGLETICRAVAWGLIATMWASLPS